MSQLLTLIWLKWRLLRNSLRSSKAVVNKVASVLGMLLAFVFSLVVSLVLCLVAYVISQPDALAEFLRRASRQDIPVAATAEFIFFSIFGFLYLMWATLPLSIGGGKQFDAGKLLMYPITLRKLFAVDFVSELTTLHSVIALPAIVAVAIGTGLGTGKLGIALLAAVPVALFGVALSKWLSTIMGSLLRRRRARAETVVALIGAVAGLGGAMAGQLAPLLFRHAESLRSLRWTPPGAAAVLFMSVGPTQKLAYGLAFLTLFVYSVALIGGTYLIARRAALGIEGRRKRKAEAAARLEPAYTGWKLPLLPEDLSAVIEKEWRYASRNAQMRMMALAPLLLIIIRVINSQRMESSLARGPSAAGEFMTYGSGLLATGGVLYVFLVLAGSSCNAFAFEEGGMRTLILSPIDRRKILLGKNIATTTLAVVFAAILLIFNTIVFRDLTLGDLLFIALSFVVFATLMSAIGNWLSIRFPKRMSFGKRMNVSGVAGLMLIPMIVVLGIGPVLATLVGYLTRNLLIQYLTLALVALVSVGIYVLVLGFHGRSLAQRETDILEAVREPTDE
ncbi:MAG: ABC transporter permease [Acidobacteria bacterium]|nr:ABC transporter permease [Acidobacteriota bacterium]